jgi:hypothetical protein
MTIDPPDYLEGDLRVRWAQLAPIAAKSGRLTQRNADAFARYIIAEQEYLRAVHHSLSALRRGDVSDAAAWSQIQDRYFRECQASGRAFGLAPDGE